MILSRDVFRLKYGKAREAIEVWRESLQIQTDMPKIPMRVLTDLTGTAYTLVLELTFKSLADYEEVTKKIMSTKEWKAWYSKFVPLVETSYRELFTIQEN